MAVCGVVPVASIVPIFPSIVHIPALYWANGTPASGLIDAVTLVGPGRGLGFKA